MPSWVKRFEGHAIWSVLQELDAKVGSTETPEEGDDRDTMEFVGALSWRLSAYRKNADPIVFTTTMLDTTAGALRHLVDVYQEWLDQTSDCSAVDSAADTVIQSLASWPELSRAGDEASIGQFVSRMSAAITEAIERVAQQRDDLADKLASLAENKDDLEKQLTALEDELSKERDTQAATWRAALEKNEQDASNALTELKQLRDEARNVVHETTAVSVGTEYREYANECSRSAKWYDISAVAFGLLGLLALGIYLFERGSSETTTQQVITRLGVTLGALTIGGFLGQRGASKHQEARAARRTALGLSRMAPFITNLPADARELLVIETADRIFTKGELDRVSDRESALAKLQLQRRAQAQAEKADEE